MSGIAEGFTQECEALAGLLGGLAVSDWRLVTAFFDWTIADEVMHLRLTDGFGLVSMSDPVAFRRLVAAVRADQAAGIELSQRMRSEFGALAPAALLAAWTDGWINLGQRLAKADPGSRLSWFGPDIGLAAFAAARQMEVWAHGQDIYDRLGLRRFNTDRIRPVCDLGVRTQGWSFRNRGLERPAAPRVCLTAPSGAAWAWNEDADEVIAGPAEDFALVVTQRRHVDDTELDVRGRGARTWMEIAQCFAGPPETGPARGLRRVVYSD